MELVLAYKISFLYFSCAVRSKLDFEIPTENNTDIGTENAFVMSDDISSEASLNLYDSSLSGMLLGLIL